MKYFEEAKKIWKAYVPANGQADTVQGELLRSVERLRWEAQNNGNMNWDDDFEILANFVKDTLVSESAFTVADKKEITENIKRILDYEYPYVEDDIYDQLIDGIVEWSKLHPDPVPHKHNDKLTR